MQKDEIFRMFMASKSGVVDLSSLPKERDLDGYNNCFWYKPCLCGSTDHRGFVPIVQEGFSSRIGNVYTCFHNKKQWLIRRYSKKSVSSVILEEEVKYLKLIERAIPIARKVFRKMGKSEEAFVILKETHGIDRSLIEDINE